MPHPLCADNPGTVRRFSPNLTNTHNIMTPSLFIFHNIHYIWTDRKFWTSIVHEKKAYFSFLINCSDSSMHFLDLANQNREKKTCIRGHSPGSADSAKKNRWSFRTNWRGDISPSVFQLPARPKIFWRWPKTRRGGSPLTLNDVGATRKGTVDR